MAPATPRALGGHLQRGLILAMVLTVPFVLVLLDVEPLLRALGQPAGVSRDAADYVRGILWGSSPTSCSSSCGRRCRR